MAEYNWGSQSSPSGTVNINPATGQPYSIKEMVGSSVGNLGNVLGLKEGGWSEWIAPTAYAAEIDPAKRTTQTLPTNAPVYGPEKPAGLYPAPNPTPQPQPQQQPQQTNNYDSLIQAMMKGGHTRDSAMAAIQGRGYDQLAREYLGGGGGFTSPEGQSYGSAEEYYSLIDQAYNPQYDYLNQAQSNLEQGQRSALEEAQTAFNTQQQMATGQKESALGKLGEVATKGQQSYESALAQARDLYDQLQRGYNQRFGGSTSAGQAATEIANRERMKQQGLNYRELQNVNRQVEMGKADVENQFKQNLLQLEQNKQSAINQVNSDFRDKLAQITQSKGMLDSAKAQAKLQALQNLRAQVLQIQQQNAQFQQSLELQRQQAAIQLDSYAKQLAMSREGVGQNTANSFNQLGRTPTSNLQVGQTGMAQTYSPTGQISTQYKDPRDLISRNIWGQ